MGILLSLLRPYSSFKLVASEESAYMMECRVMIAANYPLSQDYIQHEILQKLQSVKYFIEQK